MTTLIVEDGTGVANANSYVDLAFARSFAEGMGWLLSDDDEAATQTLLGAMPYIESRQYQGQRASPAQALSWPRKLVSADGQPIASNLIPNGIKWGQVAAAVQITSGVDLFPTVGGGVITEETVGPITTKYSDKYLASWQGGFAFIDTYLNPFILSYGGYRMSPQFGF